MRVRGTGARATRISEEGLCSEWREIRVPTTGDRGSMMDIGWKNPSEAEQSMIDSVTAYPSWRNATGQDHTDATLIAYAPSRYPVSHARRNAVCCALIAAITIAVTTITDTAAFHALPTEPMQRQAAISSPSATIATAITTIPLQHFQQQTPKSDLSLPHPPIPTRLKTDSPARQPHARSPFHPPSFTT